MDAARRLSRSAPRLLAATATVGAVAAVACGSDLRTVPLGPHLGATPPVEVATAPPPAKVDNVRPRRSSRCAWLDGRWEWVTSGWEWTPGSWVVPRDGCHFAPPEALWVPSAGRGQLFYLPGRWYRDGAGSLSCEPAACP